MCLYLNVVCVRQWEREKEREMWISAHPTAIVSNSLFLFLHMKIASTTIRFASFSFYSITFCYAVDFVRKVLTLKRHESKHDSRHEDDHFHFCISGIARFWRSKVCKSMRERISCLCFISRFNFFSENLILLSCFGLDFFELWKLKKKKLFQMALHLQLASRWESIWMLLLWCDEWVWDFGVVIVMHMNVWLSSLGVCVCLCNELCLKRENRRNLLFRLCKLCTILYTHIAHRTSIKIEKLIIYLCSVNLQLRLDKCVKMFDEQNCTKFHRKIRIKNEETKDVQSSAGCKYYVTEWWK